MNWINSNRGIPWTAANGCPSAEVLLAYLQSDDESPADAAVARHLDGCDSCQAIAERLTSPERWGPELRAFGESVSLTTVGDERAGTDTDADGPSFRRKPRPIRLTDRGLVTEVFTAPASRGEPAAISLPDGLQDRFRHLEPIGQGGCARVFRAEDQVLGRVVALKFPHATLLADPQAHARFLTELRATAVLHHPHIVALYDAGLSGHQGYIVFEYVPGPTLAEWLSTRSERVDSRLAATIVARIADGVQHAHEAGILHRDLKPSNVLLDDSRPCGELPFVPRIADFGIARFLNADVTHTIDEVVLGSPPFMSPEQALGDRQRIGPASDVYALGGILYQLLTQQLPIVGASAADTLRRVLSDEPIPPRRHRPDLPPDLEAICLKCLAKAPGERYASASALQSDLECYLAGEPVSVRPPGVWERAARIARRYPTGTALAGTIVVAVALVLVLLSRHSSAVGRLARQLREQNTELVATNSELDAALTEAQAARNLAQEHERQSRETVYAYDLQQAFAAAHRRDARMIDRLLARYGDGSGLERYRGLEWDYLRLRWQRPMRPILQTSSAQYMAVLAPDERSLAVVGQDARVRLLDWPAGRAILDWPTGQREINGACFSPDGAALWTAGDDGTICRWNPSTGERQYAIDAHQPHLAFELVYDAPRGQLISCGHEGTIRLWEAVSGASHGTLEGHRKSVDTLQLLPDGQRLASPSSDGTIRIWDLDAHSCERVLDLSPGRVTTLRCSPDGRWLAACTSERELVVFDLSEAGEPFRQHTLNEPARVCFDATSRRLFLGDHVGVIEEWILSDAETDKIGWSSSGRAWQAHDDQLSHLEWARHDQGLISASRDGTVKAWESAEDRRPLHHDLQHRLIREFTAVPGESQLLIAGEEGLGLATIANPEGIEVVPTALRLLDNEPHWNQVAVSRDGRLLAAGTLQGRVAVWRREAAEGPLFDLPLFDGDLVHGLSFTPDGDRLCVTAVGNHPAQWIDTTTGQVDPLPLANPCTRIEFTPDGRACAAVFERNLRFVDLSTGGERWTLPSPSLFGNTLLFFPQGGTLALADERKVHLYDTASGQRIRELLGHAGTISGLAVSSDEQTLATVSGSDRTVQLWHVPTGQHLASIEIGATRFSRCCFLDGDRWLAHSLDDDHIRVVRMR
ncbi:MAG TPA: serine/threonine-protein kinase [Planctomycetaceae bacterium]|nr:serine/threonine-protein kinase [Planctomycetaceae bacterium]